MVYQVEPSTAPAPTANSGAAGGDERIQGGILEFGDISMDESADDGMTLLF